MSLRSKDIWIVNVLATLLVAMFVAVFAYLSLSPPADTPSEGEIYFASLLLCLVCVWTIVSWRLATGGLFDPYGMFLIAAFLFNGGQAILRVFRLDQYYTGDLFSIYDTFSPTTVLETLVLISISMAAFHLGGLVSVPFAGAAKSESDDPPDDGDGAREARKYKSLRMIGWGLMIACLFPAILEIRANFITVYTFGYTGLFQSRGIGLGALNILGNAIIPATIFMLAGSKGSRVSLWVSGFVAFSYSLSLLALGGRQLAAPLLICYLWTYHRCVRPVSRVVLVGGGAFLLFVVFPTITIFRSQRGDERFSITTFFETFVSLENPFIAILFETGFSMVTVAYSLDLVPAFRSFDFGQSYFFSLFSAIPNFFWDIHPTQANGTLDKWLINLVNPSLARLGVAYGFSFIAEAYVNFSWFGGPLMLMAIGFALGWFVLRAIKSGDALLIAAVASAAAFFFLFARGESANLARSVTWYAILPSLAVIFTRILLKRNEVRANIRPHAPPKTAEMSKVGEREG